MSRVTFRRRPDGVIELRRPHRWRTFASRCVGAAMVMLPGCFLYAAAVLSGAVLSVTMSVALLGPAAVLGYWGARWAIADRRSRPPRPAGGPPPRRAA